MFVDQVRNLFVGDARRYGKRLEARFQRVLLPLRGRARSSARRDPPPIPPPDRPTTSRWCDREPHASRARWRAGEPPPRWHHLKAGVSGLRPPPVRERRRTEQPPHLRRGSHPVPPGSTRRARRPGRRWVLLSGRGPWLPCLRARPAARPATAGPVLPVRWPARAFCFPQRLSGNWKPV